MQKQFKTLLITDLVDSTKLVVALGDQRSGEVFAKVEAINRKHLAAFEGLEIDKTDGFLLLFDRPVAAVQFALRLHADLALLSAAEGVRLACRCGIHFGEVLLRKNDPDDIARGAKPLEVEGLAKPTTARIMARALGGQTLLSRAAYDLAQRSVSETPELEGTVWTLHGSYALKGIADPVDIGEVTLPGATPRAPSRPEPELRKAVSRPYAAMLALVILACFFGVFEFPDSLAQQPALAFIRGPLSIENTVLVGIPDQGDLRALRATHPVLIERLVDAGASVVVFDIAMTATSEWDDPLAAAMDAAAEEGVSVILPVHIRSVDGRLVSEPPQSGSLRTAATLGHVEFQQDLLLGTVRRGTIRRRTDDGSTIWAAAALALQAHLNSKQPIRIDGGELLIGGTRNAVWADQVWLQPFGEVPVVDYFDAEVGDRVTGKVVVVGAYGGLLDIKRTPFGTRYGAELHAGLIETLIRQKALHVTSAPMNAGVALLFALITGVLGWVLPFRLRPLGALAPIAGFGLVAVLAWAGVMVGVCAALLAAILAYRGTRPRLEA